VQHRAIPQDKQPPADDLQLQSFGDERVRAVVDSFRTFARALLSAPSRCINIFWGAALASFVILTISKHWSGEPLLALIIVIGTCICGFVARIAIGNRLPRWTLHIDLSIAMLFCMTLVAVGDTAKIDFSAFFSPTPPRRG
jgi:hypothetical protein